MRLYLRLFSLVCLFTSVSAQSCDLCAIYTSLEAQNPSSHSLQLGVAEQFSYYGTLRKEGRFQENEKHEHMASFITQFFAGYSINKSNSLQLILPYVNKRYARVTEETRQMGTEAGIGDVALLLKHRLMSLRDNDYQTQVDFFGGVKLPTGDSDLLATEPSHEEAHKSTPPLLRRLHEGHDHAGEYESAVHNHDLALGTGSVDFPTGVSFLARKDRFLATVELQYFIRTKGRADYRYANELLWKIASGWYLSTEHERTLLARVNVLGEYKEKDTQNGVNDESTGVTAFYAGPGILFTMSGRFFLEAAFDFPLNVENTGTQLVADYRARSAIKYRF